MFLSKNAIKLGHLFPRFMYQTYASQAIMEFCPSPPKKNDLIFFAHMHVIFHLVKSISD